MAESKTDALVKSVETLVAEKLAVTAKEKGLIDALNAVLAALTYRNLDEDPVFEDRNTTTEFLARAVFDRLVAAMRSGDLGTGAGAIESMRVTLHESHLAAAAFDGRGEGWRLMRRLLPS